MSMTAPSGTASARSSSNEPDARTAVAAAAVTRNRFILSSLVEPFPRHVLRGRASGSRTRTYKNSRLHPRHVVPKPRQAYEPEVPLELWGESAEKAVVSSDMGGLAVAEQLANTRSVALKS